MRLLVLLVSFLSFSVMAQEQPQKEDIHYKEGIGQFEFDLTGLSYHIGATGSHPANSFAPLRLDPNGAFVFNPGIGFGYDFRRYSRDQRWFGFSPLVRFIYMQDCQNDPLFLIGPGVRYRKVFAKDWSFDANILLTLGIGKNGRSYNFNFLPVPQFGFNYHFANIPTIGMVFSLAPKNTAFSATGSFWILFTSLRIEL